MRRSHLIAAAVLAVAATGCVHLPDSALALSPGTLERRQIETRRFDGIAEADLFAACAGVLQDLGFSVESSDSRLGLLTASKQRGAVNAGQIAGAIVIGLLTGAMIPTDRDQTIRATVIVFPAPGEKKGNYFVRIGLQRAVRTTDPGVTRREWLKDPALYQGFFAKLSQSIFLEAHKI
ncbi:MAG TPA: hypothetical protein VFO57_01760 [Burkholderiales bacterium]|nr:hypothetical protein [Burkholderiales bacterium]